MTRRLEGGVSDRYAGGLISNPIAFAIKSATL